MYSPEYYVLSQSPQFAPILEWLDLHGEWFEVHLNRTRFTLTQGRTYTEFMLKFSNDVALVEAVATEDC